MSTPSRLPGIPPEPMTIALSTRTEEIVTVALDMGEQREELQFLRPKSAAIMDIFRREDEGGLSVINRIYELLDLIAATPETADRIHELLEDTKSNFDIEHLDLIEGTLIEQWSARPTPSFVGSSESSATASKASTATVHSARSTRGRSRSTGSSTRS